jgi:hypothetical protein
MFTPVAAYNEKEVAQAIRAVKERFPDDVEYVRYSFHDDWAGDPALYFRILLTDRFHGKKILGDPALTRDLTALTNGIKATIRDEINEPGLWVYFSFRTVSEQRQLRDPQWD